MILPAVAIKLYCFKLFFEKHVCLYKGAFVLSIIESHFDFGCHSSEIRNEAKFPYQVQTAQTNQTKDS